VVFKDKQREDGSQASKVALQSTIFSSIATLVSAKDTRDAIISDFVDAKISAVILVEKTNNPKIREFLLRPLLIIIIAMDRTNAARVVGDIIRTLAYMGWSSTICWGWFRLVLNT
jgi:hypothetical protein